MTRTLGEIPEGGRFRLFAHYGRDVQPWIDAAPNILTQAAERWKFSLRTYHDAGHASVIATALNPEREQLLLKAWPDPTRYRNEVAVLRMWAGGPTAHVVESADDLWVAALELVGGHPGGAGRPARETQKVAAALQEVHTFGRRRRRPARIPRLVEHLSQEVWPRIERRTRKLSLGEWRPLVEASLQSGPRLEEDRGRATILHADLYRENVLFDEGSHPQLIDPLPMSGDAAFDWGFWCVYYDLGRETATRLATASRTSRIPALEIVPWCRLLAVDGLLFYVESNDPRATLMADVLAALVTSTEESRL